MDELLLLTMWKEDYFFLIAQNFQAFFISLTDSQERYAYADKTNMILVQDTNVTKLAILLTLWFTIFKGEDFSRGKVIIIFCCSHVIVSQRLTLISK